MNTLITPKNLAIDQASGKVKLDIAKIAKSKGANNITQSEYDQVVSDFNKSLATDNDFKHAANTVLFGKETYAETLQKPNSITEEMFTAVGGKNIVGLKDVDKDGSIGLSDLTDASNMAIMRRELLNPKNQLARKAFNEYYEQGLKNVAADAGKQYTPPTTTTTATDTGKNAIVQAFKNEQKQIQLSPYQVAVRKPGGKYVIVKNSEVSLDHSNLEQSTAEDLILRFGGTVVEQDDKQLSNEEFKEQYGYEKPAELVGNFKSSGELD